MTWVRYANRLEEENNGLKKLLEEALGHIDQYDYEESFDLVQRIKDSLGSKPLKAVQWGDNAVTGAEELLQKVQQLERDKLKMLADLQVESEINAKGGEREYVLRGKVEQLQRENAALREAFAKANVLWRHAGCDGNKEFADVSGYFWPSEIIVVMDRAAFDAARAEEGQSWGIDEIIRQHLREGGTPT